MTTTQSPKQQWIAALRSGEYDQRAGALRHADSYCALGVACDISGLGKWKQKIATPAMEYAPNDPRNMLDRGHVAWATICKTGGLPHFVADWLGISDDLAIRLARANDGGATFGEIAGIIEAELPE